MTATTPRAAAATPGARVVRIANCSGFFGDRIAAAADVLDGPLPIDVLTGDYLAELTMHLLWKARQRNPAGGYAGTFLRQMEQVLGTCMDRGVKVVANAGGLNPHGLAEAVADLAGRLGLAPRLAVIDGDDLLGQLDDLQRGGELLRHLDDGRVLADAGVTPITANAYLGGFGIAAALDAGADVVICPRVTDASLVVGPAAWFHGWGRSDLDALAGAVAAGHLIECGTQVTGGNYPFLDELPDQRYPGFPIAEVAVDGSSVITKQPGSGGLVSVGTVTAQLLYEIGEPRYANPDVVARFDTVQLDQIGPDRVLVHGTQGEPPTGRLKVAINHDGGHRNAMTVALCGLDIEAKAERFTTMLWDLLGSPDQFDACDVRLVRSDHPGAATQPEATAHLTVTVQDSDPDKVGRRFSNAVIELALASFAGFYATTPPGPASPYAVYWPTLVDAAAVHERVHLPDGTVLPLVQAGAPSGALDGRAEPPPPVAVATPAPVTGGPADPETVTVPLGRVAGARSGDKGGNANVGVWGRDPASAAWLAEHLTVERFRALLPDVGDLEVRRHPLPNLGAVNFVVVGLLGLGVAASTRPDPQAKALGELLRSRPVEVPASLLDP